MHQMLAGLGLAGGLAMIAHPACAQQFTTAAEVRPILEATAANWVAVREFDGNDLVYFTHLVAWRCGLSAIHYGLNGAPPVTPFPLERCHEGTAQPNALTDEGFLPFISVPLGTVSTVTVRVTYDDGAEAMQKYLRAQLLMP